MEAGGGEVQEGGGGGREPDGSGVEDGSLVSTQMTGLRRESL
jgi:hypothetical protein